MEWSTVSNAFCKSTNMPQARLRLSRALPIRLTSHTLINIIKRIDKALEEANNILFYEKSI